MFAAKHWAAAAFFTSLGAAAAADAAVSTVPDSASGAASDRTAGHGEIIEVLAGVARHQITITNVADEDVGIVIDGRVDEPIWQQTLHHDNMIVSVPGTGEPATYPTEVRMLATERGLYVSAVMYQPPDTLVARQSPRDQHIDRDSFGITLDTTGQGLFAYWFTIGLGDSVMDGKVLPERNYQIDWDGPWISKTARRTDGWSVEILLPWSMMNLPKVDGPRNVGFAVSRQVSHLNQRYQWPGHPYASSQFVTALNRMSVSGVQPRQQFSMIPFGSSTFDSARGEDELRIGADIAWSPSPKLEATASILPDFGAVEADNVVLNLTAFETYFPEKRLFFLEGNEVFNSTPRSGFGNILRVVTNENFATTSRKVLGTEFSPTPISLMNTRRIGGTANQVTVPAGVTPDPGERDLPTDLLGAGKLTGAVGDLRYGVLGAFEDDVEWFGTNSLGDRVDIEDAGRDFGVFRLLYEHVGADRKSIGYLGTMVSGPLYDAMVHGIDGHYTSGNGKTIFDLQLVASDVDDGSGVGTASDVDGGSGGGALLDLKYSPSTRIQHKIEFDYFDEDLRMNDLGFLRRNDYAAVQYAVLYSNPKATKYISDMRGTVIFRQEYNISKGQVVDSGLYWRNSMVLPGRNTLKTALGYMPSRWEDTDSRGNGAYETEDRWWVDALIATDASRMLSYSASIGAVQENLGDWTYSATAGVTFRPSDRISLDLDARYKHRDGWIVYQGGRNFGSYHGPDWQPALDLNWFIAPEHQLRLSLQWAGVRADERGFWEVPDGDGKLTPAIRTRADHDFTLSILTAQLRYRWEIAPLTDFYLVYNLGNTLPGQGTSELSDMFDDTFTDPIIESFVAKLRYRFGN